MRWHYISTARSLIVLMSFLGLAAVLPFTYVTSVPALASSVCTSTRSNNDSEEQSMVGLINAYRTSNGLSALTATTGLTRAAISKSGQMAASGVFAHDSISDTMARFSACGNSSAAIGENIAAGNTTANATFLQWKNSAEHNANMLSPTFTAVGIGRALDASGYAYWTTELGNTVDSALLSSNSNGQLGNSTQPSFAGVANPGSPAPGFPVPSTSSSGGLAGQGSFGGTNGYPQAGSIPPPSFPFLPFGQGMFPGNNGYPLPLTGTTSTVGNSGAIVGFGTLPATGGPPTLPTGSQGNQQGVGSFP
jgi:uncharacterized protein YkwD